MSGEESLQESDLAALEAGILIEQDTRNFQIMLDNAKYFDRLC